MPVAWHQTEIEPEFQFFGNLRYQVNGEAHVAIITLRIRCRIEHQEGFALQETSRYVRVWCELTGEAQNLGTSPVLEVVCSAFARQDYTC
jgi:hypothetical protein